MLNVEHLIQSGGLLLIAAIIFAESGILIGFFLPGDTLLFSAGFFAAQGKLPLLWLLLIVITAAVAGDNVGYSIGRQLGKRLFQKEDGVLFRKEYITRAEAFYQKHGGKTITLARFLPLIRTFAPIVAGASKMPRKRFMLYNILGAALWGGGVIMLGHWLGAKVPNIDRYLLPVIGGVMLLSFSPALWHIFGDRRTRRKVFAAGRNLWRRCLSRLGLNRRIS